MENEIWKECGESDKCLYEVSNMGRVKSITKVNKKVRILKGSSNQKGYLQIEINNNVIAIHTLVAYNFIGLRPDGMQIDHIDRNNQNNSFKNLRYCTQSENMKNRDSFRDDILEQDPKERKKKHCKESREKYKEKYNTTGRIKINCPCGSITNKSCKARHEKTEKHKKYLNTLL